MTLIVKDRVMESSTTTGIGALTLAGAVSGHRTFASVMTSPSDTAYYTIIGVDGAATGEWECGLGTYSGANTLTRTTVHASSNAGAAVNFSAGTKRAFISATAEVLKHIIADGQLKFPATQAPSSDPNTLDDYEEGTFTVTATASVSGTITLDLDSLNYTKIGRMVHISGIIRASSVSSPSGILRINGLPFTAGDWAGVAVYADALAAGATGQIMGYIATATTILSLFKYAAGGAVGLADNVQANSLFVVSATYRV